MQPRHKSKLRLIKRFVIIFSLYFQAIIVNAQQAVDVTNVQDNDSISAVVDSTIQLDPRIYLSKLDTNLFPTKILIDRISKFNKDINKFNGNDRVKTCNFFTWKRLYNNLKFAGNDTSWLPPYELIKNYLVGLGHWQHVYAIPIINMQFNAVKKRSIQNGSFVKKDSFLIGIKATKNSFRTTRLLAASPFASRIHGDDVTFLIDSSLYFTNSGNEKLTKIEADFDDGSGWQTLQWNSPKIVSFGSKSKWILAKLRFTISKTDYVLNKKGKVTLKDSTFQLYSHFNFLHTGSSSVPEPSNLDKKSNLKSAGYPSSTAPNSTIMHFGGTSTRTKTTKWIISQEVCEVIDPDRDPPVIYCHTAKYIDGKTWNEVCGNFLDYNILFGNGNTSGKLRKPLIVVDGFDPGNMRDYYETLVSQPTEDSRKDDWRGL
jgi:hypothetical protein